MNSHFRVASTFFFFVVSVEVFPQLPNYIMAAALPPPGTCGLTQNALATFPYPGPAFVPDSTPPLCAICRGNIAQHPPAGGTTAMGISAAPEGDWWCFPSLSGVFGVAGSDAKNPLTSTVALAFNVAALFILR
jgi:hypothetical protein